MLSLPMIALRGILVFPQMTVSVDIERETSIQAASAAAQGDHLVFVCMQKRAEEESPAVDGMYTVGTVCRVKQMLRQVQQGYSRLIVEGLYRAESVSATERDGYFRAVVCERADKKERVGEARKEAIIRNCLSAFHEYLELMRESPSAQLLQFLARPDPEHLAYFIAQNVQLTPDEKQEILECDYPTRRFQILSRILRIGD